MHPPISPATPRPMPAAGRDRPFLRQVLFFGSPCLAAAATVGVLSFDHYVATGSDLTPAAGTSVLMANAALAVLGPARGAWTVRGPLGFRLAAAAAAAAAGFFAYFLALGILTEPERRSQSAAVAGFLGFLAGVPAGVAAGVRRTRTKPAWAFVAAGFVAALLLGASRERLGLRELALAAFNAAVWFPLAADVTRMLLHPFRGRPAPTPLPAAGSADGATAPAVPAPPPDRLADCPVCRARILPRADGECPLCGTRIAAGP